jgi:hypothetical protein
MSENYSRTPQERYDTDNAFRTLVDMMMYQIIQCNYSPSELREAAILAAIQYETIHARPAFLVDGQSMRRVDGYHGRDDL